VPYRERVPHANRAAVISGCGVVAPVGVGVTAFMDALVAGRCAVAPITRFPADDLSPRHAAQVHGVAADDPDRAGAFALAAAGEALTSARLDVGAEDPCRIGVALGTTLGGMLLFEGWEQAVATGTASPDRLDGIPYYGPEIGRAHV